jgi:hypothetical protein
LVAGFLAVGFFAGGFFPAGFAAFGPVGLGAFFFGAGLAGFFADRLAAALPAGVRPEAAFFDPAVFCGVAIGSSQVAARVATRPPASPGSAG